MARHNPLEQVNPDAQHVVPQAAVPAGHDVVHVPFEHICPEEQQFEPHAVIPARQDVQLPFEHCWPGPQQVVPQKLLQLHVPEALSHEYPEGQVIAVQIPLMQLSHVPHRNGPVALPSLSEQKEIVRRVENLFALADRIEARFAEAQKRVNSISQAILAKAFRGELVPTEAELAKAEGRSFESAEELLERIGRSGEPKSKLRAKSSNPSLLAQDHSLNQAKDTLPQ